MSDQPHWAEDLPDDWNVGVRCAALALPGGARCHLELGLVFPDHWYPAAGAEMSMAIMLGDLLATMLAVNLRERAEAQIEGQP